MNKQHTYLVFKIIIILFYGQSKGNVMFAKGSLKLTLQVLITSNFECIDYRYLYTLFNKN